MFVELTNNLWILESWSAKVAKEDQSAVDLGAVADPAVASPEVALRRSRRAKLPRAKHGRNNLLFLAPV